jgi:ATP-binding cassette subfamily F protein uup
LQPEPAEAAQIRSAAVPGAAPAKPGSAEERAARKTIARLDRRLERVAEEEQALHAAMATAQSDYVRLADLTADLARLAAEKEALEQEWLEAAAVLE